MIFPGGSHNDAAGAMGSSLIPAVKYAVLKFQLQFPNHQCRGRFMTAIILLHATGIAAAWRCAGLAPKISRPCALGVPSGV